MEAHNKAETASSQWSSERVELIKRTICPRGIGEDEFALFIKPDMIERRSHIVWRNKLRIGVRFEYPASNPPSGHP